MEKLIKHSKFNLLRSAIAMAHADGRLQKEEIDWLEQRFRSLPLKPIQLDYLNQDMRQGVDINQTLPLITTHSDREMLLDFARSVFLCDGYFHETEQIWYLQLEELMRVDTIHLPDHLEHKPFKASPRPTVQKESAMTATSLQDIRVSLEKLLEKVFDIDHTENAV